MKPPRALGDLVSKSVDPLLRQRTGLKADLLAQWAQIVGDDLASHCQPVQLRWPKPIKQAALDEVAQPPATLIVSATGIWALRVQHSTGEILARINRYFGYEAVNRIAIEQRTIKAIGRDKPTPEKPVPLSPQEEQQIDQMVEEIEDETLRESMRNLGRAMRADRHKKS